MGTTTENLDDAIAAKLSSIAYLGTERPDYINLGYLTPVSSVPIIHRRVVSMHEYVTIYEAMARGTEMTESWIAFKGTDDLYTFYQDLVDLAAVPGSQFDSLFDEVTQVVASYMINNTPNVTVKFCGHSLGGLLATVVYHRLYQAGASLGAALSPRLGGVNCFQPFIRPTVDIQQVWGISNSTTNPAATIYQGALKYHVTMNDIASLLLLQPESTFGKVLMYDDADNAVPLSMEEFSTMPYQVFNERVNHTIGLWEIPDGFALPVEDLLVMRDSNDEELTGLVSFKSFLSVRALHAHSGQQIAGNIFIREDETSVFKGSYPLGDHDGNFYSYTIQKFHDSYTYYHDIHRIALRYRASAAGVVGRQFEFTVYPEDLADDIVVMGFDNYVYIQPTGGNSILGIPSENKLNNAKTLPMKLETVSKSTLTDDDTKRRYLWTLEEAPQGFMRRTVEPGPLYYWYTDATVVYVQMNPKYNGANLASDSVNAPWYASISDHNDGSHMVELLSRNEIMTTFGDSNSELPPSGDHRDATLPDESILKVEWHTGAGTDSYGHYVFTFTEAVNGGLVKLTDMSYPNMSQTDVWNPASSLMDEVHLEKVADDEFYIWSYKQEDLAKETPLYFKSSNLWNGTLSVTSTKLHSEWYIKQISTTITTGTL